MAMIWLSRRVRSTGVGFDIGRCGSAREGWAKNFALGEDIRLDGGCQASRPSPPHPRSCHHAGRVTRTSPLRSGGHMSSRWIVPVAFGLFVAGSAPHAVAQPLPQASGRVLEAVEGDVVVLPTDARITVVRRSQVRARLVYV